MAQSEALIELQHFGMTQELCDEIDAAFAMIKSQADEIESLKEDVRVYRRMAGLDPHPASAACNGD